MEKRLAMVEVEKIDDSDYQMRENRMDDTFEELVSSIRRDGVLVPILLYGYGDSFRVVAGHRRYKAAVEIGLGKVPAYIHEGAETSGWSGAFAENLFRKDLSPIELAGSIVDCIKSGDFSPERLARMLGRSESWVNEMVNVAGWSANVQEAVHRGLLSLSAGRNLAMIEDTVHREMLVNYAIDNGATARVTAAWLQAWRAGRSVEQPDEIEPEPGRESVPRLEPYTPCIICGRQQKMIELRYLPICNLCTETVLELSRQLGRSASGETGGG